MVAKKRKRQNLKQNLKQIKHPLMGKNKSTPSNLNIFRGYWVLDYPYGVPGLFCLLNDLITETPNMVPENNNIELNISLLMS